MCKNLIFAFFIFISTAIAAQVVRFREITNFRNNPGNLKLFTLRDSNKTITKNKAVVLILHGCSQSAADIYTIADWDKLAKKNDFIVLYPQQKITNNVSQCFNWMLEGDVNKSGECLSIYNMMRYAIDSMHIDSSRIFLYGVSAGACMSEVLCANYPWLINKAAICAGIPYRAGTGSDAFKLFGKTQVKEAKEWGDLVRKQNPAYTGKYPGIILMHGTADFVADYGYTSELVKQWTNVHQVSEKAKLTDSTYTGNKKVERTVYGDKKNSEAIVYYKIKGMGHKIPVDIGIGEKQGGKDKLFSEDIDFFSTYYIAKDFGLIK